MVTADRLCVVVAVARRIVTITSYRQQHAFDFLDGAGASQERQKRQQNAGHDQYVHGSGEQVCAQKLFDERFVEQRVHRYGHQNDASDL